MTQNTYSKAGIFYLGINNECFQVILGFLQQELLFIFGFQIFDSKVYTQKFQQKF